MKILIVGNNSKESEELFKKAQNASLDFKDIEVEFVFEETDFYDLPLVVVNNIIAYSGSVLSEDELKEIFKNPPKGCSGSCGGCGGCSK
ncbi:MAG: hypothetical protein PHY30_00355 [Candidatus Pacebacteria bacterium]|nr:hypothetical protein [Candidatus Paceibacterota bacterium]